MPDPAFKLQLLGTPLLSLAGQPPVALSAVDAALLAVLAVDGPQSRQALAALLWPDAGAAKPAVNLRQRIFKLKRLFQRDLVVGDRTVSLTDTLSHDLLDLESRTAADPGFGSGALLGTLAIKHNEVFGEWLANRREALAQMRIRVLDEQVRTLADQGDVAAALRFARARVQTRPLEEEGHCALIGLHFRSSDHAAAVAAYRECEALLARELGIAPSRATQDLLRLLSAAEAGPELARAVPLTLTHPPRLLGRDGVWRAIDEALQQGCTPLLLGGPGAGKTRLLSDFTVQHPGWCLVRCLPGDSSMALSVLERVLDRCATTWGQPEAFDTADGAWPGPTEDLSQPNPARARAVLRVLAQWHRAGLAGIAVDDLHLADVASMAVLKPAMAQSAGPRWLLSARAMGPDPPAGDATVCIPLQPLNVDQIEALIDSLNLPGLPGHRIAQALHRRVGGRPRALLATLSTALQTAGRAGEDVARWAIPVSFGAEVAAQVAALSPHARELAQLVALAGTAFHGELASTALGLSLKALDAPWSELRAALELDDDGRLPDAAAEAAAAALSPPARLGLHLALAQALQDRAADVTVLAHHWEQAGQWPQAAACHEQAAQAAHARSDRPAQREYWHQAARLWARAGQPAQAFAAAASEAECALTAGAPADCAALCDVLQTQARSPAQWAQVLRLHAWALGYQRDWPAALAVIDQALPAARLAGVRSWMSEVLGLQVICLALLDRSDEAQAPLAELLALEIEPADWELQLNHRSRIADAYTYLNRLPEAVSALEQCLALAERPESQTERLSLLNNSVMLQFRLGRATTGVVQARRALAQAQRIHQLDGQVGGQTLLHLALMAAAQGLFAEAIDRAEEGLAVLAASGAPQPLAIAHHHMAWIWCCLGQGARAHQALNAVPDLADLGLRLRRWTVRAALQRLCGLKSAEAPPPGWAQCADPSVLAQAKLVMAATLAPLDALAMLKAVEARCDASGFPAHALHARLLQVKALGLVDAKAAAASASAAAHELNETSPLAAYLPEMRLVLYRALAAGGEVKAATEQLDLAWEWVQRTANTQVPPVFRDSFLQRNLVNVALRQAMRRRGNPAAL